MTHLERRIKAIKTWGYFIGKTAFLAYLERGKKLGRAKAIEAKCYGCMGGYPDGKQDCLIDACPLHPYMPYLGEKK